MTYKIKVIGLDMEKPIELEIEAETVLQAMSRARIEVERQMLKWDTLEII